MNGWKFRTRHNSKVNKLGWVSGQEGLRKSFMCTPLAFKTRTQHSLQNTGNQSCERARARGTRWNRKPPSAGIQASGAGARMAARTPGRRRRHLAGPDPRLWDPSPGPAREAGVTPGRVLYGHVCRGSRVFSPQGVGRRKCGLRSGVGQRWACGERGATSAWTRGPCGLPRRHTPTQHPGRQEARGSG